MEESIPGVYFTPGVSSTTRAHEDRLQNQRRRQALGVQQEQRLSFGSADGMSD